MPILDLFRKPKKRVFFKDFESLGQYHDHWATVVLSAPDRFRSLDDSPVDQRASLQESFDVLRFGFVFVKRKVKDERATSILRELIEMSYEAYASGDAKAGAHILQECEGMIWSSRRQRVKYAVEAERRVFGVNITYAGVRLSPYPYEGTQSDLGDDQAVLLELAKKFCESYLAKWRDFSFFSWVMENDGSIKRISPEPKEDGSPTLAPIQKSLSACCRRAKELAKAGQIRACVVMNIMAPQGDGLVCYDLEQRGRPRVSARQLFELQKGPTRRFDAMKFHVEDAQFFQSTE